MRNYLFPSGVPLSKRFFDLLISITLLIIFTPVMALVALLVRINLGAPVLFRQERPGYKHKLFTNLKFRSMRDIKDKQGNPLPDSERITRLGRILRASSLDELPELVNVVKGEMSLVGPRPLLPVYLERYTAEQARRHDVLPGITGWAQINGRNAISWEKKFELDVWYVDHWNFWLDIRILFLTVWKVIKREGISQEGQATSGEFLGKKKQTKTG